MNDIDMLLIMLATLDGTLTNYHLQTLYVENYQLHLAADRARGPLSEYADRVQERIKIRFDRQPTNAKLIAEKSAELIIERPTERDIVDMCMDMRDGIDEMNYGKGAENILGDITEHLDFVIALFSKQKKGDK